MSDRWRRISGLFAAALRVPAAEREAELRQSGEAEDLQAEVLALLDAYESVSPRLPATPYGGHGQPHLDAASDGATKIETLDGDELSSGARLGPYLIVRLLGRGGMGVVYEAEDTRLGRRVALKSLPQSWSREPMRVARLRQEARLAASIAHRAVATIYALEDVGEQVVLAAELVEGDTLRAELARGPIPVQRAIDTAHEIASGLAAAHARGVVHRDLKPDNIMRATSGQVKILDFGIAALRTADPNAARGLTLTGQLVGTPSYMAPEQLLARPVGFSADQFALGILLYEMASGNHPFAASSLPETVARLLSGNPTCPDAAALPAPAWMVVQRCLNVDPAGRFPSTDALVAALAQLSGNGDALSTASVVARPREDSTAVATSRSFETDAPHLSALRDAHWWWQFHQVAAAAAGWLMLWPMWHVHDWLGALGLPLFLLALATTVIAGVLRLHLGFSARIYPRRLAGQRGRAATWLRVADLIFVLVLLAAGLTLGREHLGWAGLLIGFAIGDAVAFLVIEPATADAAFGFANENVEQ